MAGSSRLQDTWWVDRSPTELRAVHQPAGDGGTRSLLRSCVRSSSVAAPLNGVKRHDSALTENWAVVVSTGSGVVHSVSLTSRLFHLSDSGHAS